MRTNKRNKGPGVLIVVAIFGIVAKLAKELLVDPLIGTITIALLITVAWMAKKCMEIQGVPIKL